MFNTVYATYREFTRTRQLQSRDMFGPTMLPVYSLCGQGFDIIGWCNKGVFCAYSTKASRAVVCLMSNGETYSKAQRRALVGASRTLRGAW